MLPDTFGTTQFLKSAPDWTADWTGQRIDSKDPYIAGDEYIEWLSERGRDPKEKLIIASDALDVDDILGLHAYFGGALQGSTKTEDFQNAADYLDRKKWIPGRRIRVQHRLGHAAHQRFSRMRSCRRQRIRSCQFGLQSLRGGWETGRGLSDNYSKAMGPPVEIERYRRVFGTDGISNVPVIA